MDQLPSAGSAPWLGRIASPGALADALDRLAADAGAAGALIVRSRGTAPVSIMSSPAIRTRVGAYMAGDCPPDPRMARVNPSLHEGFRTDQDDFTIEEIRRDPFYQEFLRPVGIGWHACALLGTLGNGDTLHLSLKREVDRGPFERIGLAGTEAALRSMREAVLFAREIADLPPGDDGRLGAPGRFTVAIDGMGDARLLHDCPGRGRLLSIENGRLQFAANLHRDVLGPLLRDDGCCIVMDADGLRWTARARRTEAVAAAGLGRLAALVSFQRLDTPDSDVEAFAGLLRGLFGFSVGEARVAVLVGHGLPGAEIARRLGLSAGTVRNHLKAIYQKTGTSGQVELAVLLSRIEA